MARTIDFDDPRFPALAEAILQRHERGEAEANITSAVRDFLIATGLVGADEIVEEVHPGDADRKAVDLTAFDTYIEVKRRAGTSRPEQRWVDQLDGYLEASQRAGRGVRLGVLTDGRHWFLRWPGAGPARGEAPFAFEMKDAEHWVSLYEWLRDHALGVSERMRPGRDTVAEHFGPRSVLYQRDLDALRRLHREHRESETVEVKRRLWLDLLRAATGEFADSIDDLDDLFVRHTYLTAVVGLAVQARFGIDIADLARTDAADLLAGGRFRDQTGLQGVVETDFFSWPAEVGGELLLLTIARRLARFEWEEAPADVAAILYETVIPAEERRQLGEYYTPDWLVRAMLDELVTSPLEQRVLDPACGSGTFIAEAVARFVAASEQGGVDPAAALEGLREAVVGIDIHPVAVHLARSAWAIAAQPLIESAVAAGFTGTVSTPVYLGDSLQLRFGAGELLAEAEVRIEIGDEQRNELIFPTSLVERADTFDDLMSAVAGAIARGDDPQLELADHTLSEPERRSLAPAIELMRQLHASGRNHVWAYYTRNLVRPVALARRKADVIIGNPPWLNYNQTIDVLRTELERQSKELYGLWVGGRYATHQDVAGLFFARCVDLYLDSGGVVGMVMPHSALGAGQHAKWRSGRWATSSGVVHQMDFGFKRPWDLERLRPNAFFPIPACVAFARRAASDAVALGGEVERWEGRPGGPAVTRTAVAAGTDHAEASPYRDLASQGASLVPRCLTFVNQVENPARIRAGGAIMVNPRRGRQDKAPWRDLDLTAITGDMIEEAHVFSVLLGESVAPYVTLESLLAVLPVRRDNGDDLPAGEGDFSVAGVDLQPLGRLMRRRWRTVSTLWDDHKQPVNKLTLLGQLDYRRKLSRQLAWRASASESACRIVYTTSGRPTAARLRDRDAIVDHTLYWMPCASDGEAAYLLALINSDALREAVEPFMPRGLWGARHLHKHLWNLRIPRFDAGDALHVEIAAAGEAAALGAAEQRPDRAGLDSATARRLVRQWLADSNEGREVERVVGELLRLSGAD